jgi:hypothetical protein
MAIGLRNSKCRFNNKLADICGNMLIITMVIRGDLMKRHLMPAMPAMHFQSLRSIGNRWHGLETVYRLCQLALLIALGFFGGRFLAKAVVGAFMAFTG